MVSTIPWILSTIQDQHHQSWHCYYMILIALCLSGIVTILILDILRKTLMLSCSGVIGATASWWDVMAPKYLLTFVMTRFWWSSADCSARPNLQLDYPFNVTSRACTMKLRSRNLRQKATFCCKLEPFLLLVTSTLTWPNTLAYYRIHKLRVRSVFIVHASKDGATKLFMVVIS